MEFTFSPTAQPEDIQTPDPEKINRNFERLFREIGRFHEWLRAYSISLTTDITGVLPVVNGGTSFASYAIGDLLYASTTTALAKLAAVASGSVLVSAGANTAPAYSSAPSLTTSVTAPLLLGTTSTTTPLVIGGTGTASPLRLRATSGVGGINSYIYFEVGNNGATEAMRILDTGLVGINSTGPTASLHLGAGTTTRAPFKLTSGSLLTTPAVGAHEFLTDDYFVTITTGTARKALILDDGTRLVSGRVPFATTNGRLVDDADLTFSGSRLTVTDLTVTNAPIISSLTAGRVVFAGASKELIGDADLTFVTDTLTATKVVAPTSVTAPLLIGGTGTTSDLTLQTTTGVGAAGADMHFLVGNNGATEAMTILNSGFTGIGVLSPTVQLDVLGRMKLVDGANNNTFITGGNATTTGLSNVALGDQTLGVLTTGNFNTAIGTTALRDTTSGGNNMAVGAAALRANTSGADNTAIGTSALLVNTTGNENTALGKSALELNTTGIDNIGIGVQALQANTTGNFNTGIGASSGLLGNDTGSNNVFIGYNADSGLSSVANAIAIGANTIISASDALVLGSNNRVGLQNNGTPSAWLHLPAGSATAGFAPLKFTSGTLNTTAEAGAVEFLTDDWYATITTGTVRKKFVLDNGTDLVSGRVPFATTNGRLVDDADLTFATDTLSSTKLLAATSVSTPSLISTGAVTVTPAAGSNFNVTLSTTGDFAVNTDDLYVDTSTGNVGIGTSTPAQLLTVEKSQNDVTRCQIKNANAGSSARTSFLFSNDTADAAGFVGLNSSTNGAYGGADAFNIGNALNAPLALISNNTVRFTVTAAGTLVSAGGAFRLAGYTVATLPAGVQGDLAFVTDALAPAFLTAVVGGGAVITPVFYNGTNWVAD